MSLSVQQDVSSICQYCGMDSTDKLVQMVFGEIKRRTVKKPTIKTEDISWDSDCK